MSNPPKPRWVFVDNCPPHTADLSGAYNTPRAFPVNLEFRIAKDDPKNPVRMPTRDLMKWLRWSLGATFDIPASYRSETIVVNIKTTSPGENPIGTVPRIRASAKDTRLSEMKYARYLGSTGVALQSVNDWWIAATVHVVKSRYNCNISDTLSEEIRRTMQGHGALDYASARQDLVANRVLRDRISKAVDAFKDPSVDSFTVRRWEGYHDDAERDAAERYASTTHKYAMVAAFVETARMITGESGEAALMNAENNGYSRI